MKDGPKKYIFITGGVSSSLGKGLASASMAFLLERRDVKINMLKMDPYINIDPGTMNPGQHGEVFVTDDGAETDLDLGHYERFTSLTLDKQSNFTTGQVYLEVIEQERKGKYLGKTVQIVPHITNEIKRRIHMASKNAEILLAEIGGTIGDIESLPFIESIRQFSYDVGPENVMFIHLVLIPYIRAAGELKSKPAQHSVKELTSLGIFPNIILCRSDREIDTPILDKISLFCNVPKSNVFQSLDANSIYKVPLNFHKQGLDQKIIDFFKIESSKKPNLEDLKKFIYNFENPIKDIRIGIVGKYMESIESYKSYDEALRHAIISEQLNFIPVYIDAQEIEKNGAIKVFKDIQGILVPGGFGVRATEGKILAIQYARENNIPFLGICLGMQLAVIEYARNVCGLKDASSEEFIPTGTPVVHYMEEQSAESAKGGSMRLGAYNCLLQEGTKAFEIYKQKLISERHRHRLEINNAYIDVLIQNGLILSGTNPGLNLIEIIELKDHPYFIGCQYHPEFKSRPHKPHPLFLSFIQKANQYEY